MGTVLLLNALPWYTRWPSKCGILALTLLVVCFPYPRTLVRHLQHVHNPNAMIEPDAPALQPLVDELRLTLGADLPPKEALKKVEDFVYRKIPYEWDWNTWGTADYLPTVQEALAMGKEDCDGQAVVAASLLRRLGFKADLVTDFAHMWVLTDVGETMSPGRRKAFVATDQGVQVQIQRSMLADIPRAVGLGIAVFPLGRELIVLGVLWLLLLRAGGGVGCGLAAAAFLVNGLLFLRIGGKLYDHPIVWRQLVGVANLAVGFVALWGWARYNALRAERMRPEVHGHSVDDDNPM